MTRLEISYNVDGKNKLVNGLEIFDGKLKRGVIDYQFCELSVVVLTNGHENLCTVDSV